MIDPLTSAINKDLEEFKKTIDNYWSIPKIDAKHAGSVDDYSVWHEVIMRDWSDGLEVLYNKFPEETLDSRYWEFSLRYGSLNCVKFFWDKLDQKSYMHLESEKNDWIKYIIISLGEPWSSNYEVRNSYGVVEFLKSKGFDFNSTVYPGDFKFGDLKMSGHSLWTRCFMLKMWKYVDFLWPQNKEEWSSWPRLDEVLLNCINIIVGDYKPLIQNKFSVDNTHKIMLFKWLDDFAIDWIIQENLEDEKVLLNSILSKLASPSKDDISPWFRLLLHIDKEERQKIWDIWDKVSTMDKSKVWLHQIAMYPNDLNTQKILNLAKEDNALVFKKYWNEESDGISPNDRFVLMGGNNILF